MDWINDWFGFLPLFDPIFWALLIGNAIFVGGWLLWEKLKR